MADIASPRTFVPRLPLRTVGVAIALIALLVATLVYVGSRQTRLPPPFGVARNGSIAYAANGDIYTADPVNGSERVIVAGEALDRAPTFSRDGTKVAFCDRRGTRLASSMSPSSAATAGRLRS
jgi:hypothetical protein